MQYTDECQIAVFQLSKFTMFNITIPYGSLATVWEGTENPPIFSIPQKHLLSEGTYIDPYRSLGNSKSSDKTCAFSQVSVEMSRCPDFTPLEPHLDVWIGSSATRTAQVHEPRVEVNKGCGKPSRGYHLDISCRCFWNFTRLIFDDHWFI